MTVDEADGRVAMAGRNGISCCMVVPAAMLANLFEQSRAGGAIGGETCRTVWVGLGMNASGTGAGGHLPQLRLAKQPGNQPARAAEDDIVHEN